MLLVRELIHYKSCSQNVESKVSVSNNSDELPKTGLNKEEWLQED